MKKVLSGREHNVKVENKERTPSATRIYRSSLQIAQRLDIQLKSAADWKELFQAEYIGLRQKLKSGCELLIFQHPREFGRKAEELLWRKAFYEVIQRLKQYKRVCDRDVCLDSTLCTHLLSACGYYHHLLFQIQTHYKVKLDSIVSWANWSMNEEDLDVKNFDSEINDWALKACQRCLIYLGDLARYQQDFGSERSARVAQRMYYEAFHINPELGMPHNQLGTLAGNHWYGCEAAYHYMRCMMCSVVFEGTEGNLVRLFEKNRSTLQSTKELSDDAPSRERIKRFLVYFLYLQDVLYGHESLPRINSEEIGQLCQSVLQDFDSVMTCTVISNLIIDKPLENGSENEVSKSSESSEDCISRALMIQLIAMAIMSVTRLKVEGSEDAAVALAFTLAMLSQLLQCSITNIQNAKHFDSSDRIDLKKVASPLTNGFNGSHKNNMVVCEEEQTKLVKAKQITKALKKRRRRRHRRHTDSFESESASASDLGIMDSDDDDDAEEEYESDLSEGGIVDGMIEDLISDDEESEDVYVESDSENESDARNAEPRSMFSLSSNIAMKNRSAVTDSRKLQNMPPCGQQSKLGVQMLKQNGLVFGKMITEPPSDVSDAETESSTASRMGINQMKETPELLLLKTVTNDKLLSSIKVLTDWLRVNPDVITTCVESSSSLWSRMACLLNLLPTKEQLMKSGIFGRYPSWKKVLDETVDENWTQTRALPEDISLLRFSPLDEIHQPLDTKWNTLARDGRFLEVIVRVQCLKSFGMKLSSMNEMNHFVLDKETEKFLGPNQLAERERKLSAKKESLEHEERSRFMKAMAQQKLKSDVAELESTLQATPKSNTVYLVPDSSSLCAQLHFIKRLVNSEKFVMIIPIEVIAALDELKKYDAGAREAIKYLESEFKRGNRWLRGQKEGETADISKRRGRYEDVSVWRFHQVIGCCRYFVNQAGKGTVTLLTGPGTYGGLSKGPRRGAQVSGIQVTPEAVEMARSCGINVESLRVFSTMSVHTKAMLHGKT